MNFTAAADQLRRQEIARLSQYVTPAVEALRSLTPSPYREQIALMVERLGHTVHNNPTAAVLVTTKQGQKYIIACATPSDPGPNGMRDIAQFARCRDCPECAARYLCDDPQFYAGCGGLCRRHAGRHSAGGRREAGPITRDEQCRCGLAEPIQGHVSRLR